MISEKVLRDKLSDRSSFIMEDSVGTKNIQLIFKYFNSISLCSA